MNEWWDYDYNSWISWEDLTLEEQDQAEYQYRSMYGISSDQLDVRSKLMDCQFERDTGGNIFIDC